MKAQSLLDFPGLQGHQDSLVALKRGGRKEPFPSLVFGGPSNVGKRLAAIWYGAFLNCLQSEELAPCGECTSCLKIQKGTHPDLHLIRKPEKKTVVGVSDVREAIHEIHHAPFEGRFRIWIIEDGERLTDEAQNALLKTLEEPPRRAIILLVTNLEGALIPTVSSRCRLIRFRGLAPLEMTNSLISMGADEPQAKTLAGSVGGRYGSAVTLFQEPKTVEERESIVELFCELPGLGLWGAIETAQKLEKCKATTLRSVLDLGLSVYRDLLVLSSGADGLVVHMNKLGRLQQLAGQMSAGAIRGALDDLTEADHYLQRNVSPKLLLQRVCIKISKAV